MTQYLFLHIASDKWKRKNRVPDAYYTNNGYTNFLKVSEDYSEFNTEQAENIKSSERQNK